MHIVATGSAGFFGTRLVRRLLAAGRLRENPRTAASLQQ
jgi:nucleoside-diphosphate-sugar epimerase